METENLLQQAENALQKVDYKTAQDFYFQAVQKNPQNVDLWLKLYQVSVAANNFTGAIDCLIFILKISPFQDYVVNLASDIFQKLPFAVEKSARQNLRNAIQENPENIGLSMLEAKLLMLDAQNTDNFDYEKELLIRATALISAKSEFIPALLIKAQIELYLAQNLLTHSLTHTSILENKSESKNQQNSTRNHKFFPKKAKQLVEKVQSKIISQFPYLQFSPQEKAECQKPITAFFATGRSGSHFLQSLLDGYPQVSTFPVHPFRGFLNPKYQAMQKLLAENVGKTWQENFIINFCQHYASLFDASLQGDFIGEGLGKTYMYAMGLTKMGKNSDEVFKLDKLKFCQYLFLSLQNFTKENISLPMIFRLLHYAYEFALDRNPPEKSCIFYHYHTHCDAENWLYLVTAFPQMQFLEISREPVQMMESHFKSTMKENNPLQTGNVVTKKNENLLAIGGMRLLNAWHQMSLSFENFAYDKELYLRCACQKSATIRLEDIKNNPKTALINLLKWLGVKNATWHQSLERETFGDFLYAGASQNKIKGFDNSHLKKGQGTFFSQNDLRIMNLMLYPLCVKFGYRPKDNDYLQKEIAWYENVQKVETYMDFEIKIIDRLKQDFPNFENSEAMAPYFYRVKWAKRTINYMKKYQENCVGFAELLGL